MAHAPQVKIPATYIRGGTSKGVFFRLEDLPASCQQPGAARDKLFMRVIGGPDPYSAHIDGTETYDVEGDLKPRADLTLVITRKSGEVVKVPMTCRLDTAEEVSVYEAGGVLQRFAQDLLAANKAA